ncbi:hypothetical protein [Nonomuraea wenchangensis]|uniref:hypothetical protein n=1 Tax=Nonomuraea wenchangensis TaxID=568860 RepID=UPI00332FC056
MPELHPALARQGHLVIEQGLDAPHDDDLIPLSLDVIEGDIAAVLFAHGDALEWAVYEYDAGWTSLGLTAIRAAGTTPGTQEALLAIRYDAEERSRIRKWSPRGRHLIRVRVLLAERIARLHVDTRIVATPRGWAIMVWRGRRAPAISVSDG